MGIGNRRELMTAICPQPSPLRGGTLSTLGVVGLDTAPRPDGCYLRCPLRQPQVQVHPTEPQRPIADASIGDLFPSHEPVERLQTGQAQVFDNRFGGEVSGFHCVCFPTVRKACQVSPVERCVQLLHKVHLCTIWLSPVLLEKRLSPETTHGHTDYVALMRKLSPTQWQGICPRPSAVEGLKCAWAGELRPGEICWHGSMPSTNYFRLTKLS